MVTLTALRSLPEPSLAPKMMVGMAALTSSTRRLHSLRMSAGQLGWWVLHRPGADCARCANDARCPT